MKPSIDNPYRVLTYGKDATLLLTRKAVLESAHLHCDTAHSGEDFLGCITSSPSGYDVFVLCHSVPPEEQELIVEAANNACVKVYSLTHLVEPEPFIAHVRELLHAG